MKDFYQNNDFEFGDWIRASVTSYAESIISFEADCYHTLNPFEKSVYDEKKEEWNKKFEELLIENLRKFGPRSCIEEQIIQELRAIDVNTLSPYEAMMLLYDLKKRLIE